LLCFEEADLNFSRAVAQQLRRLTS